MKCLINVISSNKAERMAHNYLPSKQGGLFSYHESILILGLLGNIR